jgi:hypothetical protein
MDLLCPTDIMRHLAAFLDFEALRSLFPLNRHNRSLFAAYIPVRLKRVCLRDIESVANFTAFCWLEVFFNPDPNELGNFVVLSGEYDFRERMRVNREMIRELHC